MRSLLRSPGAWIIVVAIAYLAVQIVLFDERRFLEWDEAIYVGEASSRFPAPGWSAHRSVGVLWVAKPILLATDSMVLLRVYLAVVSAAALGFAFSFWLRPGRWLAPVGMAVFAFGWLPVFYGSELSPNLWVAFAAVGATGALVAFLADERRLDLLALGVFVAAAVFLRLSDGLVLAGGLGLAALLVMHLRRSVRVLVAIGLGLLGGMVPWLVESVARFGGPIERLENASDIVGGGPTWNLLEHLYLADGPLIGPDRVASVNVAIVLILVGLLVLAGIGVFNRSQQPGSRIALGIGLLLGLPYFVYVEALAPRFLLPAMAVLALAVSAGMLQLWGLRTSWGVTVGVLLLISAAWSLSTADRIESDQYSQRDAAFQVAAAIASEASGDDCRFFAQYGYPQIMVASGCGGTRADLSRLGCQLADLQERAPEIAVFVALVSERPEELASHLTPVAARGVPENWTVYTVQPGNVIPCPVD